MHLQTLFQKDDGTYLKIFTYPPPRRHPPPPTSFLSVMTTLGRAALNRIIPRLMMVPTPIPYSRPQKMQVKKVAASGIRSRPDGG